MPFPFSINSLARPVAPTVSKPALAESSRVQPESFRASDPPSKADEALAMAKRLANSAKIYYEGAVEKKAQVQAQIKSGHLFKFLNLVEFPNERNRRSFRVGIVGDPRMEKAFQEEPKRLRGRPIEYVQVRSPEDVKKLNLALLHVDGGHPQRESLLRAADGENTLTTESLVAGQRPRASMTFVALGKVVRFQANVDNIRRADLKVSPRLVKVASRLYKDSGPGSVSIARP